MQYTTRVDWSAIFVERLHVLVILACLSLALLNRMPDSIAGWITQPPMVYVTRPLAQSVRRRMHSARPVRRGQAGWEYLRGAWPVPLVRSAVLSAVWLSRGCAGPAWIIHLPWAVWLWQVAGLFWPWLGRQPEWRWGQRLSRRLEHWTVWVGLGLVVANGGQALDVASVTGPVGGSLEPRGLPIWGLGCVVCGQDQPSVTVAREVGVGYRVTVCGHFNLVVADDDSFRTRLLVLFLRQLEIPDEHRGSRRTRAGRTPFVRQQVLARDLGIPQPDISRWERYWQAGDWRRLLSQHAPEVLTYELQRQIIETWARWPAWGAESIHSFLVEHGVAVTESQVAQAARDSGWQIVRAVIARLCVREGERLRLGEGWLLGELLSQVDSLLAKLETGQRLTPEDRLDVAALQAASTAAGLVSRPCIPAKPWLRRVEWVLFGPWDGLDEAGVACIYCGSRQVSRKSRQPRVKQFLDEHDQVQTLEVYRYYCHNPACDKGSFTALPPGLVPYSRHRLEVHVLAVQGYAWSRSAYRRVATGLGVSTLTAYRWVSAFGHELLPVAALFGVVKSSGVVGVDEKWVKVPKNSKPEGKMRRWMYVYLAVDVYTYDLLHIAIYPDNTAASARAFLLALRAKGYQPRVIVTDLRPDYGPAIATIFPKAEHHECIFHFLKWVHRQLRDTYGAEAVKTNGSVARLQQAIDTLFEVKTQDAAQRRYAAVMALRDEYVRVQPDVASVFDSLAGHWPKLVNAIGSDVIPTTNNAVELVNRRFEQHYQNFCGFESLETAHVFLGVFEKVYRFSPLTQDAQPRVRGRSPLELAGYDVAQLPMASVCRGWALAPSTQPFEDVVPNL
jgi:transposase-like protein